MAWKWNAAPPQHLVLHSGATFEIYLDIIPSEDGTLPAISWDISRLVGLQAEQDASDIRRLRIHARWDNASFSRVFYRVEDHTLRSHGIVTLEVPLQDPSSVQHHTFLSQKEGDLGGVLHPPQIQDQKEQDFHEKEDIDWELVDAFLEVWRGDEKIQSLSRPLPRERSMTVGRFSLDLPERIDLDLAGHFPNESDERLCSRLQAEIFWRKGRLWVQDRGRHPIYAKRDPHLLRCLSEPHPWAEEEVLLLPGGLSLRLVLEEKSNLPVNDPRKKEHRRS
ncbi:hypothetical protein L6R29_09165 [Myxococcota bacterium]|nr:hypothetical protein [Myxococcota bacterium]